MEARVYFHASPSAEANFFFQSSLGGSKVDRANGVIRDVSVITGGIVARGHELAVDDETLKQILTCCQAKGKVPVKWNHKTGADAVCGWLCNFRMSGKKVLGDWHLLKSHERYALAMDQAEAMPECLGLSAAFTGAAASLPDGRKAARCSEVLAVDLVAQPAANPDGLFSAEIDKARESMSDTAAAEQPPVEFDAQRAFQAVVERLQNLEHFLDSYFIAPEGEEDETPPAEGEETATKTLAADVKEVDLETKITSNVISFLRKQREEEELSAAQAEHEQLVETMLAQNDAQKAEIKALKERLVLLDAAGGKSRGAVRPAKANAGPVTTFAVPANANGDGEVTFEILLSEKMKDTKAKRFVAFSEAKKERPDLFADYQKRRGIFA